jgi:methionine-rich copper-binding protein CopC
MFNAIPIKISITFIKEIEKSTIKIYMETQEAMNSQGSTQSKEQSDNNKNSMVLA